MSNRLQPPIGELGEDIIQNYLHAKRGLGMETDIFGFF